MNKSNYRPVVGKNNARTGFREAHTPAKLPAAAFGTPYQVRRIDCEIFDDETGRWKFFLPPGTVAFNANLYYYYAFEPGAVVMRLGQPPSTPVGGVTPANAGGSINESVLRRLIAGDEVLNYSQGAPANSLALSSPDNPIDPMQSGGWVYVDAKYPGGKLQRGLLQVFVKADDYERWFAGAAWDGAGNPDEKGIHTPGRAPPASENHEERTLRFARESGLIPALMMLARETDEPRFVQQAIESGTWAALLRFANLARAGGIEQ